MQKSRKGHRLEQIQRKKEIVKHRQAGEGLYIFRNKSDATLSLPKPAIAVKWGEQWDEKNNKMVPPRGEWKGDSYFLQMVGRDASIVKVLQSKDDIIKETPMNESLQPQEKLILDQPDTVTPEGKLEHVITDAPKQLNEGQPQQDQEVLLTEDPLEGVDIIME